MFVWTTLVLLFGVTLLGEIIDAENVIDGCGKSNSKMCEFSNCDTIHVRRGNAKKFVALEHLGGSQTVNHKIRLMLFVRGAGNCHIMLSTIAQLNGTHDAFYDFVIGDSNNSVTIIRRQRKTVISQQTHNVLSLDEPVEIKIEISSHGDINVYREGRVIVHAFDQDPLNVKYVSLGNLNANGMDYYYNCRDNADFDGSDLLKGDSVAYAGVYNSNADPRAPTRWLLVMHGIFCSVVLWWRI